MNTPVYSQKIFGNLVVFNIALTNRNNLYNSNAIYTYTSVENICQGNGRLLELNYDLFIRQVNNR